MEKWILIDNDDSFTNILSHYLQQHADVLILHKDTSELQDVIIHEPNRIILSPGPGSPSDSKLMNEVIQYFYNKLPILGVCLGHQALGEYFGAECKPSGTPRHGKISIMQDVVPHPIFDNLDIRNIQIMHYHSLVISGYDEKIIKPLAYDDNHQLMAFEHRIYPIMGLQFHPESILTIGGDKMIENWSKMYVN